MDDKHGVARIRRGTDGLWNLKNKEHDMSIAALIEAKPEPLLLGAGSKATLARPAHAFAQPRDFLENRFVYLTISPRARGLSIGVNLNPDRQCNFDCVYCEVDRNVPASDGEINCDVAAAELEQTLRLVQTGSLRLLAPYSLLPQNLLELRHVALSGDGEPTLSPNFLEALETVVAVRARGFHPFFKIVLITNASGLDRLEVQEGLKLLTPRDEVWAKLEVGSQSFFEKVNKASVPLQKITENILLTAQKRPVTIQSLFCQVAGEVPSLSEIEAFANRLLDLKTRGAKIPLVQIYSATRPTHHSSVRHLPLKTLSDIAETVRRISGLKAEPF
jgi:wyosine [tRNA(Phe)-imidazoG37] synthetase (radical SAM superfamily)